MYYLLINTNNVIMTVSTTEPQKTVENDGLKVWKYTDGSGLMDRDFRLVEVETIPDGIVANQYCYSNEEFTLNPNYRVSTVEVSQVKALENKIQLLELEKTGLTNRIVINENLKVESDIEIDYRLSMLELGLV